MAGEVGAAHAATGWRSRMAEVHAAVDRLVAEGAIGLSWKGRPLPVRSGPYRIARVAQADETSRAKPEN